MIRHAIFLFLASTATVFSEATSEPQASPADSQFAVELKDGAILSLKPTIGATDTEYVASGGRLGDVSLRYRQNHGDWQLVSTALLAEARVVSTNSAGNEHKVRYQITAGDAAKLNLEIRFNVRAQEVLWTVSVQNATDEPVEIGDLSVPLTINRGGSGRRGGGERQGPRSPVILKHSFVSGHGSFLFWMRADNAGPYLTMIPVGSTHLEYWQGARGAYNVFIHSAAAGEEAKERGADWRQPHTSLTLTPKDQAGDSKSYSFKFRWADDYDAVRQILVDDGGFDTHVVPGMTVPSDLFARLALRTKQPIYSVAAEFPDKTEIKSLGTKGDYRLYQVRFARLGENRLNVKYGDGKHMFLEFFSTEPLETLIKKRAAFLARSQHRDVSKWYDGLITDWNMETQKLISPDDYAPIPRGRYYAVTCDDPGLGKPAFLAAKNAEYPVQAEVEALDYYITNFVWGGLQQTTDEPYSYAIYGIPDWKTNRESADPGRNGQRHLWRVYDYPHVIQMYFAMYRIAKLHPHIKTALAAREYLRRAHGTAHAMFTVPFEIERWSAYNTGFYNELVITDVIEALEAEGSVEEASTLRAFWERKVRSFVNREQDLFRSEYAFDSTGFESTHALARYAVLHADGPGRTNSGISEANAARFMERQMAANLFCRGWIEPAYYYLGSDYRGGAGNAYTLTYMSQMGGWGVLDYALNFASDPAPYLRLGYASYLSAWALMNSGTPESNYGYWYPGEKNDGGAGGGFEPAPFGRTWLGQPHQRGSWYFACEIDLGYCGALRSAATVLADDPIFGRYCLGGELRGEGELLQVFPKDGLRRRFHARLGSGQLSLILDGKRFAPSQPILLKPDMREFRFELERDDKSLDSLKLLVAGSPGDYVITSPDGPDHEIELVARKLAVVDLRVPAGKSNQFTLLRRSR